MKVNNFMMVVPVHSIQKLYLSHNCCPGLAVFHKKKGNIKLWATKIISFIG